jgi:hypothetical protein
MMRTEQTDGHTKGEMNTLPATLPEGWFPSDSEEAARFYRELQKELPPGHLLFEVPVEVVAHRDGTDDILCRHSLHQGRFTVIHLSWSMRQEIDANHPHVEVDGDFTDFLSYEASFYGR